MKKEPNKKFKELQGLIKEVEKLVKINAERDKEIEELTKQLITKKIYLNTPNKKGDC